MVMRALPLVLILIIGTLDVLAIICKKPRVQKPILNRDLSLAPQPYPYVALLYNGETPNKFCLGAIISDQRIIGNCLESENFKYEYAKVGLNTAGEATAEYKILNSQKWPGYETFPFYIHDEMIPTLWSARDAMYLYETEPMNLIPGVVKPIEVQNDTDFDPSLLSVIFLDNNRLTNEIMQVEYNECCSDYFARYSSKEHVHNVTDDQFCVVNWNSANSSYHSQPIMIHNDILFGVVAWSTVASTDYGVDPYWVGSKVAYYKFGV